MRLFKILDLFVLLMLITGRGIVNLFIPEREETFELSVFYSTPAFLGWQIIGIVLHFLLTRQFNIYRFCLMVFATILCFLFSFYVYHASATFLLRSFADNWISFVLAMLAVPIVTLTYITVTVLDIAHYSKQPMELFVAKSVRSQKSG